MFLSSTLFSILVTKRQRLSCSLWFFIWRTRSNVIIKNQIIPCVQISILPHLPLFFTNILDHSIKFHLNFSLQSLSSGWYSQPIVIGVTILHNQPNGLSFFLFLFFLFPPSFSFFVRKKKNEWIWWIRKYKFKSLGPKVTNRKSKSVRDGCGWTKRKYSLFL